MVAVKKGPLSVFGLLHFWARRTKSTTCTLRKIPPKRFTPSTYNYWLVWLCDGEAKSRVFWSNLYRVWCEETPEPHTNIITSLATIDFE